MGPWGKAAVYILISVVFLGLIGYIYLLLRNQQKEQARWKRIADQRYKEGRSEASQILRAAVDQIADDKNRLSDLTDRELMTETLMGLAGLGRRMDRMEDNLRSVTQLEELLGSVNEQADTLFENARLLNQQVSQVQDAAASFQSAVAGTGEAVYSLSDSAHSIDSLLSDISGQIGTLTGFSASFGELQDQVQTVIRRMNQAMKASADNPAAAISQMDDRVTAIYHQLENLADGLNLMARSLEEMQETLDTVKNHTLDSAREPVL